MSLPWASQTCPVRGPARGAARRHRRVPGIAGDAEDLVEGLGPGAEFGRVGLGHDHAAARLDTLDHGVGACRHVIGEDGRAEGGADAGHLGQVLDRHRQAPEIARRRIVGVLQALRVVPRAVEATGRQRVDGAIGRGDLSGGRVDQVQGGDVAGLQAGDGFAGRQPDEFVHDGADFAPRPRACKPGPGIEAQRRLK
jgi:hypothetical protein